MTTRVLLAAAALAVAAAGPAAATDPQVVTVVKLPAAPVVDGATAEWPAEAWTKVAVAPADDKVEHKAVGKIEVELAAGVAGDRFFVAARWPDDAADVVYRPWRWTGSAYKRAEDRDDMFALRFHLSGEYDRCMISDKTYGVDVWLWSAGRTNGLGLAEDMAHRITTDLTESAAEYKLPSGATVYITKGRDAGDAPYETVRAGKTLTEEVVSSVKPGTASGSAADVQAKGAWAEGRWQLEMTRKLDTGQPDDAVLAPGRRIEGAIAVFNRSQSENKSVSQTLIFALPQ